VHLGVDSAVAHLDLEGSHVSPGVVPGVNAEPVVGALFNTPADDLDGVASEGGTSHVLVDTGRVSGEIFVDGKRASNGAVGHDFLLDLVNTADVVAGLAHVLVAGVVDRRVGSTSGVASRLDLDNVIAFTENVRYNVMSALSHGVVVAELVISEIATGDNTEVGEPLPGGANLATVAAEGLAVNTVAAAGGVGDRKEGGELTARLDADSVVKSLGGTVGPAGTAVGLVTNVVNDGFTLGPGLTSVEVGGKVSVDGSSLGVEVEGPVGIDNGTHHLAELLTGGTVEAAGGSGGPGGGGVVDVLDVSLKVNRLLAHDELGNGLSAAELEESADRLTGEVREVKVLLGVESLFELGVDGVHVLDLFDSAVGGVVDDLLAEVANNVGFSEEFVALESVGDGSEGGDGEGAHMWFNLSLLLLFKVCSEVIENGRNSVNFGFTVRTKMAFDWIGRNTAYSNFYPNMLHFKVTY
jgi:hypothetical protein